MESEPQIIKLRMQIGANRLHVEGPVAVVTAILEQWKRLIGLSPQAQTAPVAADAARQPIDPTLAALVSFDEQRKLPVLRRAPAGKRRNADAALLLLYAFEAYAGGDQGVARRELMEALRASRSRFERLDRVLAPYLAEGLILKHGGHMRERYRLSDAGRQRAARLARILAAHWFSVTPSAN